MTKTLLVMSHQIRESLRNKTFIIFAFGVPILLGLVALVIAMVNRNAAVDLATEMATRGQATQEAAEGYVDLSGLIQTLPPDLSDRWMRAYPGEEAAEKALRDGQIDSYYVIPPDYLETGEILNVRPAYNVIDDSVDGGGRFEWLLDYNLLGGDAALAERIGTPMEIFVTDLSAGAEVEQPETWFTELFPTLMTLILYMVILLPAGMLVNAVADEKKNRVMEVLMVSVSPRQLITGKILGLGILGLLETAIWVSVLWGVANFGGQALSIPEGFSIPTNFLVWALVYFLMGYAMYGALLAGVGALVPDVKESRGLSFVVMSPLILGYTLNILTISRPDSPVALLLSLFPLTSPVSMISRMTAAAVPLWQLLLAAVLQLLAAIVIIRLSARLFRTQHLLSGQPVTATRFLRTLVGAA